MLDILIFLAAVSAVLTGVFIYRITKSAREFKRLGEHDREARIAAHLGFSSKQMESADWDMRFLRGAIAGWVVTMAWGLISGVALLAAALLS